MNAIAYTLFGNNPLYVVGALRNAEMIETVFPGWKAVFYLGDDVPPDTADRLMALGAIVRGGDRGIKNEVFRRFLIADDASVERFLVRDTDSRLLLRDYRAVQAWIESGLPFHAVRDHPHHTPPLMAGLWGGTTGLLPNMHGMILESGFANQPFNRETLYGADQTFLARYVWPQVYGRCLEHDSCTRHIYPTALPFPDGCQLGDARFVGEIVDANEVPNPIGWQMRINYMTT